MRLFSDQRTKAYALASMSAFCGSMLALAATVWSLYDGLTITADNAYWLAAFPAHVLVSWVSGQWMFSKSRRKTADKVAGSEPSR